MPSTDYTPIYYGCKLSKCGNYLEINWSEGNQVLSETESLEETNISNEEMFNKYEDSDDNIYESDESDNDDGSNYDDF